MLANRRVIEEAQRSLPSGNDGSNTQLSRYHGPLKDMATWLYCLVFIPRPPEEAREAALAPDNRQTRGPKIIEYPQLGALVANESGSFARQGSSGGKEISLQWIRPDGRTPSPPAYEQLGSSYNSPLPHLKPSAFHGSDASSVVNRLLLVWTNLSVDDIEKSVPPDLTMGPIGESDELNAGFSSEEVSDDDDVPSTISMPGLGFAQDEARRPGTRRSVNDGTVKAKIEGPWGGWGTEDEDTRASRARTSKQEMQRYPEGSPDWWYYRGQHYDPLPVDSREDSRPHVRFNDSDWWENGPRDDPSIRRPTTGSHWEYNYLSGPSARRAALGSYDPKIPMTESRLPRSPSTNEESDSSDTEIPLAHDRQDPRDSNGQGREPSSAMPPRPQRFAYLCSPSTGTASVPSDDLLEYWLMLLRNHSWKADVQYEEAISNCAVAYNDFKVASQLKGQKDRIRYRVLRRKLESIAEAMSEATKHLSSQREVFKELTIAETEAQMCIRWAQPVNQTQRSTGPKEYEEHAMAEGNLTPDLPSQAYTSHLIDDDSVPSDSMRGPSNPKIGSLPQSIAGDQLDFLSVPKPPSPPVLRSSLEVDVVEEELSETNRTVNTVNETEPLVAATDEVFPPVLVADIEHLSDRTDRTVRRDRDRLSPKSGDPHGKDQALFARASRNTPGHQSDEGKSIQEDVQDGMSRDVSKGSEQGVPQLHARVADAHAKDQAKDGGAWQDVTFAIATHKWRLSRLKRSDTEDHSSFSQKAAAGASGGPKGVPSSSRTETWMSDWLASNAEAIRDDHTVGEGPNIDSALNTSEKPAASEDSITIVESDLSTVYLKDHRVTVEDEDSDSDSRRNGSRLPGSWPDAGLGQSAC